MLLPIAGAILPAMLWMVLFYRSDRFTPEPKKFVARTFVVGALVGAARAFSLKEMPFKVSLLFVPVFVAPFLEEIAKFFSVSGGPTTTGASSTNLWTASCTPPQPPSVSL